MPTVGVPACESRASTRQGYADPGARPAATVGHSRSKAAVIFTYSNAYGHIEYAQYQVSAPRDDQPAGPADRPAHRAPAGRGFTYNLAFSGADIDPFAGDQCSPTGGRPS